MTMASMAWRPPVVSKASHAGSASRSVTRSTTTERSNAAMPEDFVECFFPSHAVYRGAEERARGRLLTLGDLLQPLEVGGVERAADFYGRTPSVSRRRVTSHRGVGGRPGRHTQTQNLFGR